MYRRNRLFHCVLFLGISSLLPSVIGCQNQPESASATGKAGANAATQPGAPPAPANLSPEVKQRIAEEQAQFQARSQQQQNRAQAPAPNPGGPK